MPYGSESAHETSPLEMEAHGVLRGVPPDAHAATGFDLQFGLPRSPVRQAHFATCQPVKLEVIIEVDVVIGISESAIGGRRGERGPVSAGVSRPALTLKHMSLREVGSM
jgi:hypothetical protein